MIDFNADYQELLEISSMEKSLWNNRSTPRDVLDKIRSKFNTKRNADWHSHSHDADHVASNEDGESSWGGAGWERQHQGGVDFRSRMFYVGQSTEGHHVYKHIPETHKPFEGRVHMQSTWTNPDSNFVVSRNSRRIVQGDSDNSVLHRTEPYSRKKHGLIDL